MKHIKNKKEFYELSRRLLLGNRLETWPWEQFKEIYENSPKTLPKIVGVRHVRAAFTNKGNSGLYPRSEAYRYGIDTPDNENLLFDEGAVHDRLTLQGEVMTDEKGLYVRYSFLQCHQRTLWHISANGITGLAKHQLPHNPEILKNGPAVLHARGLQASALLQKYFDFDSWEDLNRILGCQHGELGTYGCNVLNFEYPIVEFACFDRPIGVLGQKVIIWECRTKY